MGRLRAVALAVRGKRKRVRETEKMRGKRETTINIISKKREGEHFGWPEHTDCGAILLL